MDQHQGAAFTDAREEVGWFFAAADAAMGLHAQCISETSGGGRVWTTWDDVWSTPRLDHAHGTRRSPRHRAEVSRRGKVHRTLDELAPALRADLALAYTPFGASRTTWQALRCFSRDGRLLIGLVLHTRALQRAYAEVYGAPALADDSDTPHDADVFEAQLEPPAFVDLLAWIEDEVRQLNPAKIKPGRALPQGHPLFAPFREAEQREEAAIAAYDALRIDRIRAERRPGQELLAKHRAEAEARERVAFEAKLAAERAALWSGP